MSRGRQAAQPVHPRNAGRNASGRRLAGITYQGATFADEFTYAGSGQLTSVRTGPIVRTFAYDSRQRVQRLTVGSALDLTYGYDRTNNVLEILDARPGESQAFDYDALHSGSPGPRGRGVSSPGPMTPRGTG